MTDTVKGTRPITATNTPFNALSYMIETQVKGLVNTAIPVRVDSVQPGAVGPVGYVSATPLLTQMDGYGNAIQPQSIPKLPYCRLQGGKAAIIIDPKPGDIGIALFAQQDISSLTPGTPKPVTPGSFRSFDMSDGIYFGGILNQSPEVYIELKEDGDIVVVAPSTITIKSPDVTVEATTITLQGDITIQGNVVIEGRLQSTGEQTGAGINLSTHVHGGVQPGDGRTTGPE